MIGIVVIAYEDTCRVPTEGLMNHRLDAMAGNYRALGRALNKLGRHQFLCDHDESLTGLSLLFVFPTRAVNPTVASVVRHLNLDDGDIRVEGPQKNILFPGARTGAPAEIIGGFRLEPLHHFGSEQRLDGYEGDAECAGEISEREREAAGVDRDERAVLPRAVHAARGTEPVERTTSDNQLRHQPGAHEQIRLHPHDALGYGQILLSLADEFVSKYDGVAGNGKSTEGDVRAVRNALDYFGNGFDFIWHGRKP